MQDEIFKPGTYASIPKALLASPDVSPAAKLVWISITERLGGKDHSYPGAMLIAKDTGLSKWAVLNALPQLEAAGWLTVKRENDGRTTNVYRPTIPTGVKNQPVGNTYRCEKPTGRKYAPNRLEIPTGTGVKYPPELPNITTQVTTQGAALGAAGAASVSEAVGIDSVPAKIQTASKRLKLTDEHKVIICSSSDNLTAYFCFGFEAVGKPASEWIQFKPTATNWAPLRGDFSKPEPEASEAALAAWAWLRLSCARSSTGATVTLPTFGRLIGTVKTLRAKFTFDQFVSHVAIVTGRWIEIQNMLGNWGRSLALDESTLAVPQVIAAADSLSSGRAQNPQATQALTNTGMTPKQLDDFGQQLAKRSGRILL